MAIDFNRAIFLSKHLTELKSVSSAEYSLFLLLMAHVHDVDKDLNSTYVSYKLLKDTSRVKTDKTLRKNIRSLARKEVISADIQKDGVNVSFRPYLLLEPELQKLDHKLEEELRRDFPYMYENE